MRRTQRGSALVICLIVIAALTAILASYSQTQRVAFMGASRRIERVRAARAAESGLARALAELEVQTLDVPATLSDPWAVLGQNGSERFVIGDASFRIEIVDANARVNLNTASQDQLYRLPLTTEQVDSLMDWREDGPSPRQEGAKDEYYTQLPEPYITAMRPLQSFDELLLVKGFNVQTLYEPPTEEQPNPFFVPGTEDMQLSLYDLATVESQAPLSGINGVTKTNINNGGAQQFVQQLVQRGFPQGMAAQIAARRPYTRIGDVFAIPGITPEQAAIILDNYTVAAGGQVENGKININTASEGVLASMPGVTSDIAQSIVARQPTTFQSLGEITTIPGMTMPVLQQCADLLTIGSSMFIVRVVGTAGSTSVALQALVTIEADGLRVLKRLEPPFYDMPGYWRWEQETFADVILWEGQ